MLPWKQRSNAKGVFLKQLIRNDDSAICDRSLMSQRSRHRATEYLCTPYEHGTYYISIPMDSKSRTRNAGLGYRARCAVVSVLLSMRCYIGW